LVRKDNLLQSLSRELLPVRVAGCQLDELILPIQRAKVVLEVQRPAAQGVQRLPIGVAGRKLVMPAVAAQVVHLANEVSPLVGYVLLVEVDTRCLVPYVLAAAYAILSHCRSPVDSINSGSATRKPCVDDHSLLLLPGSHYSLE
jgi:hypothetical protein